MGSGGWGTAGEVGRVVYGGWGTVGKQEQEVGNERRSILM